MRVLALFLLGTLALCAGDVTGKWKGARLDKDGKETDFRVFLFLKQEGDQLTGTAGTDEYEQTPIRSGTVRGEIVQFEVPTDSALYKLTAKLEKEDVIQGEVTVDRSGETEKFTLAVKRVAETPRTGN